MQLGKYFRKMDDLHIFIFYFCFVLHEKNFEKMIEGEECLVDFYFFFVVK